MPDDLDARSDAEYFRDRAAELEAQRDALLAVARAVVDFEDRSFRNLGEMFNEWEKLSTLARYTIHRIERGAEPVIESEEEPPP